MICAKEGRGALGLLKYMPPKVYGALGRMAVSQLLKLEELRFTAEKPLVAVNGEGCFYVDFCGNLVERSKDGVVILKQEIDELFRLLCDGSVYAVEENIKNGYITAAGGHRVGICGTYLFRNGKIEAVREISGINIRIAHEITGVAEGIAGLIADNSVASTLIVSPPGGGKTTMLRDICRILGGDGYSYRVAVADERGEIAAMYKGKCTNNVGNLTCVIDGCPKNIAMEMLLRSMGPDVVITDEIGNGGDEQAIKKLLCCGVKVIASAHGKNFEDIKKRMPFCVDLFEKIIIMDKKEICEVIDVGV